MDKNNLSEYAWILITVMILAIILVAAAPLGRMTKDNIDKSVEDNVANAFEEPDGIPDIARITGRITDKNDEYVGDYAVYLLGEDGSITETKTDKNGRYTFYIEKGAAAYKEVYVKSGEDKYSYEGISSDGMKNVNINIPKVIANVSYAVTGHIFYVDDSGNKIGLSGVSVSVIDKDTRVTVNKVSSDSNGTFSVSLSVDEYDFEFADHTEGAVSYVPENKTITVAVTENKNIEVSYKEAS